MDFKQQAMIVKQYAAELMQIDLDRFKKEVETFTSLADSLSAAKDAASVNHILKTAYLQLGITLPWQGDFDLFMSDRNNRLVFE